MASRFATALTTIFDPAGLIDSMHLNFSALRVAGLLRISALALLPFLLAACATDDELPPVCPAAVVLKDADRLVKFQGNGRDLTDVLFELDVDEAQLVCEYDDDLIESALGIRFIVARGPADRERAASFRYFVAVATRDREILAREEFELTIPFEGNRTRVAALEEVFPNIPLRPGRDGEDYLVYIGIRLTPEELQYNRQNR
ncbi:hypothetical protein [Pelagibius sp. Alg239-R121]|uniref:hypothetical protein n=1 Tax=Pelagibius sp. Alg239-R121 TaxID=2993448 RepID=UPI0024A6BEEA|nr:hypothetical protein [Pelagibius sp. Alg239-R121]